MEMKTNEKIALLFGILLGDGCLSRFGRAYHIAIAGHKIDDKLFLDDTAKLIKSLINKDVKIRNRKRNTIAIAFSNKNLFLLLKEKGFPVGKKGPNLLIPNIFPSEMYKFIVQGYFATDGCLVLTDNNGILYPRIEFSSISKNLLEQVLKYLRSKGMFGKIYISHKYNNGFYTLYRIQCNGKKNLETFAKEIGFVNPKHKEKFKLFKEKSAGTGI